LLARGLEAEAGARLVHSPELDLVPTPSLDARIETLCEGLRAEGRRVERLPVYRVGDWSRVGPDLQLSVGITDYGVALAQRIHPEWFSERLPTLAVCALTMCGPHAVVEHRSGRVAISAGLLHVKPSGNLQPPEAPLDGLTREAHEELALPPEELSDCRLLGLALCHGTLLDLIYRWECGRPLEQLLAREGHDAWEHDRLLAVDCRPEPLAAWCRANYLTCSPPGHAAFMLEGQRLYGDEWFAGVWSVLDGRGTDPPS